MSQRSHKHSDESEAVSAPSAQEPQNGVSPAEIAEAAYQRWVERGCPQGSAEEDWLEAEKELMGPQARSGECGLRLTSDNKLPADF